MVPAIDLRSDTVTRPSRAMREAMVNAEVGDDVYGEDPSVRALEEEVAALLRKEAALFVPSGTMSNQIALLIQTRPGDEVILGHHAHIAWYESGAGAALAGVQFASVGSSGLFSAAELARAIKPERDYHPRTRLVALENTHNWAGGLVFPQTEVAAIAEAARRAGLNVHLDGARIWNAAIASAREPAELAAPFDTVSVCFSKGLGAPVGSALLGTRDAIRSARRYRKMLGGGMRQAGVLAAAARFALQHHRERLALDHEHARLLGQSLRGAPGLIVDERAIETNIVLARTGPGLADELAKRLASVSVLAGPLDAQTLRFVTHLDVGREDVLEAARRIGAELDRTP